MPYSWREGKTRISEQFRFCFELSGSVPAAKITSFLRQILSLRPLKQLTEFLDKVAPSGHTTMLQVEVQLSGWPW